MSLVSVHNEWDPIEEIIIGSVEYANLPGEGDPCFSLTLNPIEDINSYYTSYPMVFSQKIVEETKSDINLIVDQLNKLGIITKRATPIKVQHKIRTLDWETEHYFCYCPRDTLLAIGDLMIECPSGFRSRYFETFSYQDILLDYMKSGTRWIAAPKPRLLDSTYNYSNSRQSVINENEPIFDAANVLRAGKDIFYLVSDSGNELGHIWLQSILGEKYKVHPCRNVYSGVHIDTTMCLLRPGMLLLRPGIDKGNLPEVLRKWDILTCPEMVDINYSNIHPLTSRWLGMNILMLSPDLAMVDKNQLPLINLLEKHGINVIPILLRHGKILAGGPHCITLDVRRKGALESYF